MQLVHNCLTFRLFQLDLATALLPMRWMPWHPNVEYTDIGKHIA